MKTLSHNSIVRLPAWPHATAKVGTLNGFCPDFAETARKRGDAETWTVFAGSVISSDPSVYDRARRSHAGAHMSAAGNVAAMLVDLPASAVDAATRRGDRRRR